MEGTDVAPLDLRCLIKETLISRKRIPIGVNPDIVHVLWRFIGVYSIVSHQSHSSYPDGSFQIRISKPLYGDSNCGGSFGNLWTLRGHHFLANHLVRQKCSRGRTGYWIRSVHPVYCESTGTWLSMFYTFAGIICVGGNAGPHGANILPCMRRPSVGSIFLYSIETIQRLEAPVRQCRDNLQIVEHYSICAIHLYH